jgi:hypothetical protein
MTHYVVLYDHRGVLIGAGMVSPWPRPHSADTAPAVQFLGRVYSRTEEWEEHGGKRCRVYIALQEVNPVAL